MAIEPLTIPLSKGAVALVDADDYERVAARKWYLMSAGYAVSSTYEGNYRTGKILMHRFILEVPSTIYVDHVNRNKLDNRRINLRQCSMGQNIANGSGWQDSHYKGVYSYKTRTGATRWAAHIKVNQRKLHIGSYGTEAEAALAYNTAALKYFGEFARVNVVNADGY